MQLANNPTTSPKIKHIDARLHFIRERVANREFDVVRVRSAEKHADFIANPLSTEAFRFHRTFVMNWC